MNEQDLLERTLKGWRIMLFYQPNEKLINTFIELSSIQYASLHYAYPQGNLQRENSQCWFNLAEKPIKDSPLKDVLVYDFMWYLRQKLPSRHQYYREELFGGFLQVSLKELEAHLVYDCNANEIEGGIDDIKLFLRDLVTNGIKEQFYVPQAIDVGIEF